MGYDEAFRNVIITSRAHLSLQDNHLVVQNGEERARLYIKDLHCVILESPQITLTQALLNALAQSKVLLLTCDRTHAISGVFTPFLGHFANAQVAREHIAVSAESKAKLWQQIVQNKIHNQARVLRTHGYVREAENLAGLCERVLLEDSSNVEANAAALYFKTLFGEGFSRKAKHKIHNALLDYGYAIVRGCVIRSVCMSGLLTWAGIKHSNQFNQFNLCDDIIEVFRPFVDRCVLGLLESRARGVMESKGNGGAVESRGDCVESTQYQSLDSKFVRVRGKASLYLPFYVRGDMDVGEYIRFMGSLTGAEFFAGEYDSLMGAKYGVYYTAAVSDYAFSLTPGKVTAVEQVRFAVRNALLDNCNGVTANFLFAMIFGDTSYLSYSVADSFRNTGTAHLFAVSGLHVALLFYACSALLNKIRMPKVIAFGIDCFILIGYSALCSFSPSVLRSAVMILVSVLCKMGFERYDALTAGGISASLLQSLYLVNLHQ